jgi:hypothetical protein
VKIKEGRKEEGNKEKSRKNIKQNLREIKYRNYNNKVGRNKKDWMSDEHMKEKKKE